MALFSKILTLAKFLNYKEITHCNISGDGTSQHHTSKKERNKQQMRPFVRIIEQ